jgi:glycosyltransferase involved in cell wall biosynthesis
MYKGQTITVIMPCLNEEQGVEQVLTRMPEFVDQVIVVDNGSTDRTSEVARRFGAQVIREDARGYGRSYKTGFAAASGDIIITTATTAIRPMRFPICWKPSSICGSIF